VRHRDQSIELARRNRANTGRFQTPRSREQGAHIRCGHLRAVFTACTDAAAECFRSPQKLRHRRGRRTQSRQGVLVGVKFRLLDRVTP
jgi:hypothetical protein